MRIRAINIWIIGYVFFTGCTNSSSVSVNDENTTVDFGNLRSVNTSDIINEISFIALETTKSSIVGEITQVEIYNDKIYVLDSYLSNTLYIFSIEGKYLNKLEREGDGPGEFISPHSFWIDPRGYLLILDRQLNRLLRYNIEDYTYIDQLTIPYPSPVSFGLIPDTDLYVYYYPVRREIKDNKQIIIADRNGNIIAGLLDAAASGKILHGTAKNQYIYDNRLCIYPYFSNKVYAINKDSLNCRYELSWGDRSLPPEAFFRKYEESHAVMNELITGNNSWIRLIYLYETEEHLIVKYYIKKDFYVSLIKKDATGLFNFKYVLVNDDLGIGGRFPLPAGTNRNLIIGELKCHELDSEKITNRELQKLMQDKSPEDNAILALYSIK